jgi:hypothetical protein
LSLATRLSVNDSMALYKSGINLGRSLDGFEEGDQSIIGAFQS